MLTLIPLFSGSVPNERNLFSAISLLGMEEQMSPEFLIGTWRYSEEFSKWGITDREKARVRTSRTQAWMSINQDGTLNMVNLFQPAEAKWELVREGILIQDPKYPERGTQFVPIRKRDNDRIWVLLPFSGGAAGIGMERVRDSEKESLSKIKPRKNEVKPDYSYEGTKGYRREPNTWSDPSGNTLTVPFSKKDFEIGNSDSNDKF
jgi:hypothetical protein